MSISRWAVVALAGLAACSGGTPGAGNGSGGGEGPGAGGDAGGGAGGVGGAGGPNKPVIGSFAAAPADLPAGGGEVTLTWAVTGAAQIVIDPGVGMVSGTSAKTTVTATTTFTLSATNGDGTVTRSAIVMVGPASKRPVILSFTATPASLPMGGGQTTLRWQVQGAQSLSIDQGIGAVTGDSRNVTVAATTIYTMTATNADGNVTATTAVVIGQNPASRGALRFSTMMSPTSGETFVAPATLRLMAAGRDGNISTNSPSPGLGGNASKVQFFVDDQVVAEVAGSSAEYWIFKTTATGIAPGQHRVWARAILVNPADVLDSEPALITVVAAPAYDRTVALDADVVLTGTQGYELIGTPDKRIRLNGNGRRITSAARASGNLTLKYVDLFDVGSRTTLTQAGIEVATTGAITIEDSTVDTSNTVSISLDGAGTASVRRNLFRSNTRNPLGQQPESGAGGSYPVVRVGGTSTGAKVFAGNNIGAGWISFSSVNGWVVGGDKDEDSNILIGPRVGIHVLKSSNVQVRRNFSHHVYLGGWSQGNNFELASSPTILVEHNVIYGSSWPVRGVGCEFRYNLVARAGHQWLWADSSNGFIHHNVFAGGNSDIGGIYVLYNPQNVRLWNNTFDGQLDREMVTAVKMNSGTVSLKSNAFINVPKAPTVSVEGGTLTADYNVFFNPQTKNYSDDRRPTHDLGAGGAQTDPKFTDPVKVPFDLDESAIWKRTTTVRDALSRYRARYMPRAGSPLIDAGDPEGGTGNDVGAVGAGEASATDKFGLF